jgi:hypothetical protein
MHISQTELLATQQDLLNIFEPDIVQGTNIGALLSPVADSPLSLRYQRLAYAVGLYTEIGPSPDPNTPLGTKFGKAVLGLLQTEAYLLGADDDAGSVFCLDAEMRLMQSVGHIERDELVYSRSRGRHIPGIIITNTSGQPLGLVKHRGDQTMYTWKSVDIPTANGLRRLPAAAFSEIKLARGIDMPQAAKQIVVAGPDTITSANFGRFDMTHFSGATRMMLAKAANTKGTPQEVDQITKFAATYRPTDISQAIMRSMLAA